MQRAFWTTISAAVVVLLLAACADSAGQDDDGDMFGDRAQSGASGQPGSNAEESASDDDVPSASDDDVPSDGGTDLSFANERKVIFETRLELSAEDVTERYHEVSGIAQRAGGFVADSRLTTDRDEDEEPEARITIRVPTERRAEVLDELRQMPGVEMLSDRTSSTEVTEEYTDLQSRLRNLERNEVRYLELLDRADTVADILSVSERLDSVRSEIERVQGRLNVLDDLVDLATITVTLVSEEEVEDEDEAPPSFGEAWTSAWGAVAEAGRFVLAGAAWLSVAAIVLAPLAVVASGLRYAAHRRERPAE